MCVTFDDVIGAPETALLERKCDGSTQCVRRKLFTELLVYLPRSAPPSEFPTAMNTSIFLVAEARNISLP